MLTGSSDEDTLLANISASVMMMAPASPLDMYVNLSLRLVSNLAMCGEISPIKLISPVTHIIDDTINVAIINMIKRRTVTLTPRAAASSSFIERMRICLYNKVMIIKPAHVTKKGIARLSFETPLRLPMIQYSIEASCFQDSAASLRNIRIVCATE